VRARAPSKQEKPETKQEELDTHVGVYLILLVLFPLRCDIVTYVPTYILLTSKPIHELRLDLNVANTVIALTIRVI